MGAGGGRGPKSIIGSDNKCLPWADIVTLETGSREEYRVNRSVCWYTSTEGVHGVHVHTPTAAFLQLILNNSKQFKIQVKHAPFHSPPSCLLSKPPAVLQAGTGVMCKVKK